MSTLGISIIALVVFVVGLVLVFNLWQARANRRLLRQDERFDEEPDGSSRRESGRSRAGLGHGAPDSRDSRDSRAKPAAKRWAAADDRNAWARQRREPTLLADDAAGAPHAGAAERIRRRATERARDGIDLDSETLDTLRDLAAQVNVPFTLDGDTQGVTA